MIRYNHLVFVGGAAVTGCVWLGKVINVALKSGGLLAGRQGVAEGFHQSSAFILLNTETLVLCTLWGLAIINDTVMTLTWIVYLKVLYSTHCHTFLFFHGCSRVVLQLWIIQNLQTASKTAAPAKMLHFSLLLKLDPLREPVPFVTSQELNAHILGQIFIGRLAKLRHNKLYFSVQLHCENNVCFFVVAWKPVRPWLISHRSLLVSLCSFKKKKSQVSLGFDCAMQKQPILCLYFQDPAKVQMMQSADME